MILGESLEGLEAVDANAMGKNETYATQLGWRRFLPGVTPQDIAAFQQWFRITADGVLGPASWLKLLEEAVNDELNTVNTRNQPLPTQLRASLREAQASMVQVADLLKAAAAAARVSASPFERSVRSYNLAKVFYPSGTTISFNSSSPFSRVDRQALLDDAEARAQASGTPSTTTSARTPSTPAGPSVWERVSAWVKEHKTGAAIVAGGVVVLGLGAYVMLGDDSPAPALSGLCRRGRRGRR